VLDRHLPDLFAKVHQNWKVMAVKGSPFQWLREILEDFCDLLRKFAQQRLPFSGNLGTSIFTAC